MFVSGQAASVSSHAYKWLWGSGPNGGLLITSCSKEALAAELFVAASQESVTY
jgi:hypothetical protein